MSELLNDLKNLCYVAVSVFALIAIGFIYVALGFLPIIDNTNTRDTKILSAFADQTRYIQDPRTGLCFFVLVSTTRDDKGIEKIHIVNTKRIDCTSAEIKTPSAKKDEVKKNDEVKSNESTEAPDKPQQTDDIERREGNEDEATHTP